MADNILGSLFQSIADEIKAKTGRNSKIAPINFPSEIASIVVGTGGGESDDTRVKYVTFMYGDRVLYKQPVIAGDTCKDPIVLKVIDTPTKESTVQYTYAYSGWSLTDGGSANSSALTNVTEDRTVWAAFSSTVRSYNVVFYDDDGTILKETTLPYGTDPKTAYVPAKTDHRFTGWTPNTSVTGDMTYTAGWAAGLDFANMSWAEIDTALQEGKAEMFALGSTKYIDSANISAGSVKIVGINHDDLADGSGKAGLTLELNKYIGNTSWASTSGSSMITWTDYKCNAGEYLRDYYNDNMPSALKGLVKAVKKTAYDPYTSKYVTEEAMIFPPALVELMGTTNTSYRLEEGTQYAWYTANDASSGWTRTKSAAKYAYFYDKTQTGDARAVSTYIVNTNHNIWGLFCI